MQQLDQVEQLFRAGQYPRVIALANELDAPMRQALGESRDYGSLLNLLAAAYGNVGDTVQAEAVLLRSLRIFERLGGPQSVDVAVCLNNLGEIAKRSGRIEQAIDYFQRALAIQEARGGASPAVANILNSIAGTYIDGGRAAEVEPILKRAIAIWQRTRNANPVDVSRPLTNLATAYGLAGRYADAEPLYRQAIDLKQRALGREHPDLIAPLNGLGDAYAATGRGEDAVAALKYSLAISEHTVGANHPTAIPVLTTLGSAYSAAGDAASAEATFQRLLTLQKSTLGPGHPSVALTLSNLAVVSANTARLIDAVALSRDAVTIASASVRNGRIQAAFKARSLFETHLRLLDEARRQSQPSFDPAEEAFRTAQWINESTAAGALNQLATRFGAGNDALAQLVREHQNAVNEYRRIDEGFIASISSLRQRNPDQDAATRARSAQLKARIAELEARLRTEFPAYAGLREQQPPLPADEAQRLLKDDEALVYFHVADTRLHLFVVTRQDLRWIVLRIGRAELAERVRLFRLGLDVAKAEQSIKDGKPELFDLDRAHDMYQLLFPADAGLASKQQWVVVPTGPLTAMPFGILVTAKADTRSAGDDMLSPYRTARWLALETATSILPSVGSLKTVRVAATRAHAAKPMIGYGDPIFGGDDDARLQRRDVRAAPRRNLDLAFTDYWTGAGVDRAKLSKALPRLADTEDELRAIARSLDARDAVVLGADATETAVKSAPLADYRVVYFSTHGLVAGDVDGIAEPSLAFTLPAQPTALDDGLLTASEIARLSLNADWVVLSACNTAAGGKPGAEGLSGLVRAFFYAGARSVLVTHWSVLSDAATTLTSATFKSLIEQPQLGRAEALRRATVDMIKDRGWGWNAYPAVWGPFEVVGANTVE